MLLLVHFARCLALGSDRATGVEEKPPQCDGFSAHLFNGEDVEYHPRYRLVSGTHSALTKSSPPYPAGHHFPGAQDHIPPVPPTHMISRCRGWLYAGALQFGTGRISPVSNLPPPHALQPYSVVGDGIRGCVFLLPHGHCCPMPNGHPTPGRNRPMVPFSSFLFCFFAATLSHRSVVQACIPGLEATDAAEE